MKTYSVVVHVRAECPSDAIERLEDEEESCWNTLDSIKRNSIKEVPDCSEEYSPSEVVFNGSKFVEPKEKD